MTWGLMTCLMTCRPSTLVGHFVSSKRIREMEEMVEEMRERDRGERGK